MRPEGMIPAQFVFGKPTHTGFDAHIPAGLESEEQVKLAVGVALLFPDYYGVNWNAMDECICDLEWLPPGDVMLHHADIPLEREPEMARIYLSVLSDAVAKWDETRGRKFTVTFPPECEERVMRLIAET